MLSLEKPKTHSSSGHSAGAFLFHRMQMCQMQSHMKSVSLHFLTLSLLNSESILVSIIWILCFV